VAKLTTVQDNAVNYNTGIVIDDGDDLAVELGPQSSSFTIKRRGGARIKCHEIAATSVGHMKYPAICLSFKGNLFDQQEVNKGKNSNVLDFKCKAICLKFHSEDGKVYHIIKMSNRYLINGTYRAQHILQSLPRFEKMIWSRRLQTKCKKYGSLEIRDELCFRPQSDEVDPECQI
jgi:hypothetical protein